MTDLVSGAFTDQTLTVTVPAAQAGNELGVRISKLTGGAGTYLDFDHVRLTEVTVDTAFDLWADGFAVSGATDDPDLDGLPNLLEFALGHSPLSGDHPGTPFTREGAAFRVTRRIAGPAGITYVIQSSTTLLSGDWGTVLGITTTPVTSDGIFETVDLTIPGGWDPVDGTFYRLVVETAP